MTLYRQTIVLALFFVLNAVGQGFTFGQIDEMKEQQARQQAENARTNSVALGLPGALLQPAARAATAIARAHPVVRNQTDAGEENVEASAKEDETVVVDTAQVAIKQELPGDKFVRFHMWDGSIVGGDVSMERLTVDTQFGKLEIPVNRITSFHPGLDSYPQLSERLATLVEGLGDRDYDVREKSHREITKLGTALRTEILRYDDGGSAERKKHLNEIRKEIEEKIEEADEEELEIEKPLIRGDTVVTSDFSIVGRIQQPSFAVNSRYGKLVVQLADVKFADRSIAQEIGEIRKVVSIPGATFFQRKPKSSGIRVNKGDRIAVRASGTVDWTNWNNTSSPDGMNSQGQWHGINCGTLVGMIGKSSDPIKLGSRADFVAKQSGILYLGIAVRDNHAENESYRWEGEFKVKMVVTPKDK